MPLGFLVFLVIVLAFLVVIGLCIGSIWRLRRLYSQVGAFPCAVSSAEQKWNDCICVFGAKTLNLYRQLSLSPKPVGRWNRQQIEILSHEPVEPSGGGGSVTSRENRPLLLNLRLDGVAYRIILQEGSFAAVVSWMDAEGPREEPTN